MSTNETVTTYTNKDLRLSCSQWEEFGGDIFSDNHAVIVDTYGNMRLIDKADGLDFDADGASAVYLMSFGSDTTKRECDQFVSDYVNAWMTAAHNEYVGM